MFLLLQTVAVVVVLVIAFWRPRTCSKWFCVASIGFSRIARRQALSIALVGLLAFGLSAGVSLLLRIPEPRSFDEFSYLLAADTFAHGRLSNPTHPLWVHFESFFIIQQPSYASMYPPAQGLMLATGQVIGGHPIVGMWIGTGLACAAICRMLLAWLPPRWALLGGLLAVLHLGILLQWGQSYWGGTVAVIGGALVFGALRRIVRRPRVPDALLMGVGLAILANSRPFEGLVVSLPVATVLLVWIVGKNGPAARVSIGRIALPILVVLTLMAGAMGFYNLRVTSNALRMPELLATETYSMIPLFLWQHVRSEPIYRHKEIRDYYKLLVNHYMRLCSVQQCSIPSLVRMIATKVKRVWKFYLGPVLSVPLVMLPWVLRNRWMRFALLTCSLLIATLLTTTWLLPHYAAPLTGLLFVLVLQGMRRLRLWRWRSKPTGQFIVRMIPVMCAAFLVVLVAHMSLVQKTQVNPEQAWNLQRARLLSQLEEDEGRHLVIVRYGPEHHPFQEWVYNEADIDNAKVVWARELEAAQNRRLLGYFQDRQTWLLEADAKEPKLVPYPPITSRNGTRSFTTKYEVIIGGFGNEANSHK